MKLALNLFLWSDYGSVSKIFSLICLSLFYSKKIERACRREFILVGGLIV